MAEIARLMMTASRRLQLAAEGSGAVGIALRRWRGQTEASDFSASRPPPQRAGASSALKWHEVIGYPTHADATATLV